MIAFPGPHPSPAWPARLAGGLAGGPHLLGEPLPRARQEAKDPGAPDGPLVVGHQRAGGPVRKGAALDHLGADAFAGAAAGALRAVGHPLRHPQMRPAALEEFLDDELASHDHGGECSSGRGAGDKFGAEWRESAGLGGKLSSEPCHFCLPPCGEGRPRSGRFGIAGRFLRRLATIHMGGGCSFTVRFLAS